MIVSGRYVNDTAYLNRQLRAITGGNVKSSLRPDVAAVRPDQKVDIVEVLSRRQNAKALEPKYATRLATEWIRFLHERLRKELTACARTLELADRVINMKHSLYRHIIGSNLLYNDIDSCVYLDGISNVSSIYCILDLADYLFRDFGYKISQIVVDEKVNSRSKIRSMRWFKDNGTSAYSVELENITGIQFFPSKRKTVDETWRPEIYLSINLGSKVNSAFFSIKNISDRNFMGDVFEKISNIGEFCAAYFYDFPSLFSSLAYYHRIVVVPSSIGVGRYGEAEARRLEIFRDNTEIGILGNDGRKFYSACHGYVRDTYPTMILSECHHRRKVNGHSLIDLIAKSLPVSIEHVGHKVWLRVKDRHLLEVQKFFDENQISLSGKRIAY